MPYPTPPSDTQGPVGDGDYVVHGGDCIESIAAEAGHLWKTVWDHPQNAKLKSARSPNVLLPGDRVHIPEKELKYVDKPTDQTHKFVKKIPRCKLRLCIKRADQPCANQRYVLVVDGKTFDGTTDNDGWIQVAIPPDARSGRLTLGSDPLLQQEFDLELGGMDPITEVVGIQKRLRNLGFECEPTGEMDDATAAAIAMFQKNEDLDPTGEVDGVTRDKLKERYGS